MSDTRWAGRGRSNIHTDCVVSSTVNARLFKPLFAIFLSLAVVNCGYGPSLADLKSGTARPSSAPSSSVGAENETIEEQFSENELVHWKERSFRGNSNYRAVTVDGRTALEASTDGTASLLFRQRAIDLNETPVIEWSWKISGVYPIEEKLQERKKSGDDFPARIYVVYQTGILPSDAKAINYVWSTQEPIGAQWPNPYSKNARMVVVATGNDRQGEWVTLQRNVRQDFKELYGIDPPMLHGYAVMVDGDNTGNATTSWFDFIRFKSDPAGPSS